MECLTVMNDVAMADCRSTFEMKSSADTPVTVLCGATDSTASESDPAVGSISDDRDVKKQRRTGSDAGTAGALSGLGPQPDY